MTTLTIAQVNEGEVFNNGKIKIAWCPWREDWLDTGVQITAMMIICTPGKDNLMVGFDVKDSDELQSMIDGFWE